MAIKVLFVGFQYTKGLTLCLLVSSSDDLCKQFGPRSGPKKCRARSGSKQFDTVTVFQKKNFDYVDFEINQQAAKSMKNNPVGKEF